MSCPKINIVINPYRECAVTGLQVSVYGIAEQTRLLGTMHFKPTAKPNTFCLDRFQGKRVHTDGENSGTWDSLPDGTVGTFETPYISFEAGFSTIIPTIHSYECVKKLMVILYLLGKVSKDSSILGSCASKRYAVVSGSSFTSLYAENNSIGFTTFINNVRLSHEAFASNIEVVKDFILAKCVVLKRNLTLTTPYRTIEQVWSDNTKRLPAEYASETITERMKETEMAPKETSIITSTVDNAKQDLTDGAWRGLTRQLLKTFREPLLTQLDKRYGESTSSLVRFLLSTDVGEIALAYAVGWALDKTQQLATEKSPVAERLSKEFRVLAMDKAAYLLIDIIAEPIRDLIGKISLPDIDPS